MRLREAGIDIRWTNAESFEDERLVKALQANGVDTVLDIGANVGLFGTELFQDNGYNGEVISFEPLPDEHAVLCQKAARWRARGKKWRIAPPVAVGATSKKAVFHVAGNGQSSSLLEMTKAQTDVAPETSIVRQIDVTVRPLHELVDELDVKSGRLFLKIDTQGNEPDVLTGAEPIMDRVMGIKLELSTLELYDGLTPYYTLDQRLRKLGFVLWDVSPVFRNAQTAQLYQFDGLYIRS